jgi:hypothetical protein
MLDRIIGALRGAGATGYRVGGREVRAAAQDQVERFVGESPSGSIAAALRAWPDDGEPLLCHRDLPTLPLQR